MKQLLFLLIFIVPAFLVGQERYSRAKIWTKSHELQELSELGLAVDHAAMKKDTYIISDFSASSIEKARDAGFKVDILIKDVKAYYTSEAYQNQGTTKNVTCDNNNQSGFDPDVPDNFQLGSMAGYFTYQEFIDEIDAMAAQYPNLISQKAPVSDTLTHEGRPIYYLKLSDDPGADQGKPRILYSSIHHAREPGSLSETLFFMWYMLENYGTDPEVTYLVDNLEIFFVPMINPDGYIHNVNNDPNGGGMHRKNKNPAVGSTNPGVDLNRNYSYQWNTTGVSTDPNNDTYPGTSAFSEPETQNMKKIAENWGVSFAINAHTYSGLMLYPIGATNGEFAADDSYFNAISTHMVEFSGYEAMKASDLYPASGDSDDYMYKEEAIFAMTPEVSYEGFWAPQTQIIDDNIDMLYSNIKAAHLPLVYGVTKNLDLAPTIDDVSGDFNFEIQRLGQQNGPLTVSIDPITGIQSVGNPETFNLLVEEIQSGSISYQLAGGIQYGDEIKYAIVTDNGLWQHRDTIVKTYGSATLQFSDPAANLDNWTGNWALTNEDFYSPDFSFTDSPNQSYGSNEFNTYRFKDTIDLVNATAGAIRFRAKWAIEANFDYVQFQVSNDYGNTWEAQCGIYTNAGVQNNGNPQPVGEPLYDGVQQDWILESINLSDYIGDEVMVRFVLVSDNYVQEAGFFFDDFEIMYDEVADASLSNQLASSFNVFPNPANEYVKVAFQEQVTDGTIAVHTVTGERVFEKSIQQNTKLVELDVQDWKSGVYFVTWKQDQRTSSPKRIVISR